MSEPSPPSDRPSDATTDLDGPEISLVLGGGGVRGLAHFGVLRVLEEEGIRIGALSANSAGAIAAAVYQQCGGAEAGAQRLLDFLASPAFQRHGLSFTAGQDSDREAGPSVVRRMLAGWRKRVAMHLLFGRPSLFRARRLRRVIDAIIDEGRIEDAATPLRIVAIDLFTGEEVVLREGDLRQAIQASCSVPGFFPPVTLDGRTLIDAGHANNLPILPEDVRGVGPVVAVSVSDDMEQREDFATGIEIMLRAEEIGSRWNNRLRARDSDVYVAPRLDGRYWLDFRDPEAVVAAGEEAMRAALPRLRKVLTQRGMRPAPLDPLRTD